LQLSDFDKDCAAENLHPLGECATGQIAAFWPRMAALQLVGIGELFTPACKQNLHAFKPARGMPRKLASFHPHCAYACTPITAHSTLSN